MSESGRAEATTDGTTGATTDDTTGATADGANGPGGSDGGGLDVCLLVNGDSMAAWQRDAVAEMLARTDAAVSVVVRNRADRRRTPLELLRRAVELREWTVVSVLRGLYATSPPGVERVPLSECAFLADAEMVDCEPVSVDGWKNALPDPTVERLARAADLGLLFGFGVLVGDVLEAFEHGILSFHHGDFRSYRGQPAGCWEFIHDESAVGITLQRITDELDAGAVAAETRVPIEDAETWSEIRRRLFEASGPVLARAVAEIDAGTMAYEHVEALGPLYTMPAGIDAWRFLAKDLRGSL